MSTVFRSPALSLASLTTLVRGVAADASLWRPRLVIPDGADRWWARLSADDAVDVWLLSWLPGHCTDLHDHGGSAAVFAVVDGVLTERRLRRAGGTASFVRGTGSVAQVAAGVVHDVHGAGTGPAVSIHAYSPPLQRMTYYDPAGRQVRIVRSSTPEEELTR
jgi:predicted metal-dependent enzyme (double-stranded beta helix superfamily)